MNRSVGFFALCVSLTAAAVIPAHAQDASTELAPITVTAERRSQSILSVGNSVSAITGDQLVNQGITSIADLAETTPGVMPAEGFGYTQVYVRGVGNNIYVGADPSVATYIDGVPRIYGTMENNFVNVDRIEILKGAQGGLYGRNATGGVLNIITRQPGESYQATADVSYGSLSTFHAAAYLNIPITDDIAWNVSLDRDSHSYYVKNLAATNPYSAANFPTGSSIGTPAETAAYFNSAVSTPPGVQNEDFWAVDSKLAVKIGSRFKLTIDGDFNQKEDSSGAGAIETMPGLQQATSTDLFGLFGINANIPNGFYQTSGEKFATFYGLGEPKVDLWDYGTSATAVYSLDGLDLTSISAFRRNDSVYFLDGPVNSPPIVPEYIDLQKHYFYQELRATSTGDGPLQYMAGATWLTTNFDGQTIISYLPPFPAGAPTLVNDQVRDWSFYGQVGYDITSAVNLTVSGRYITETNDARFTSPVVAGDEFKQDKFLPAATLKYTLPNSNILYARFAEGFKAGGVNPVAPPSAFPAGDDYGKVFTPETVDTYEIGYRAALFDHSVELTSAVFYNDYKNLQTITTGNAANPGIVEAIVNAQKARTYGAEFNVDWRALPWLTLNTNVGYLEAEYTNFANTNGSVLNTFNYSGQTMLYAPKWQAAAGANIDKPINQDFKLVASWLTSYTGGETMYLSAIAAVPNAAQGGYSLSNLKVGVRTTDNKYEVSVFATNVFDRPYYTVGSTSSLGTSYVWGNPRIVGGELTAKF